MRVMLVGPTEALPAGIDDWLAANQWSVTSAPDVATATARASDAPLDAVILNGTRTASVDLNRFLRLANDRHIAAVVVGSEAHDLPWAREGLVELTDQSITTEDLSRRLSTLTRFQSQVRRMERELEHMQVLGERLSDHYREIDDEMRLASRLQRDFLPRNVDAIGPLRFATMYRPASWLSGDIFDIQRIDDQHVAFYVADAVGHGVAAALLTMFIKRTLSSHHPFGLIDGIPDPSEALRVLNDALADQSLPRCQFVTSVYCVINTETLVLKFARGGHPYPYRISADTELIELKSSGGLMGLPELFDSPTREVQLHPGDKIVLFTDGIENAFEGVGADCGKYECIHKSLVASLADRSAAGLINGLNDLLDKQDGSLRPADDITFVVMEVSPGH